MKRIAFVVMAALMLAACQESLEERCEREAREFTEKKCPSLITPGVKNDRKTYSSKGSRTLPRHRCEKRRGITSAMYITRHKKKERSSLKQRSRKRIIGNASIVMHSLIAALGFILLQSRASCWCKQSARRRSLPASQPSCRWSRALRE